MGLSYRCFPVDLVSFFEHLFVENMWMTDMNVCLFTLYDSK